MSTAVSLLRPGRDADLAIAIRTASLKDGVAPVQAGAGVADSVPALEYEESCNKAAAAVESVVCASTLASSVVTSRVRRCKRASLLFASLMASNCFGERAS